MITIMSQDKRTLVNSDYVRQFYIEENHKGVQLMATTDTDIQLGTYNNIGHAEKALEFIGICLVDKGRQNKITQVPTPEDIAEAENFSLEGLNPSDLKKALARALSSGGGVSENHDDSELDLESLLKSILN